MKKLFILGCVLLCVSCTPNYKKSFDCKVSKGLGCESLSKVSDLSEAQYVDQYIAKVKRKKEQSSISKEQNGCRNKVTVFFQERKDISLPHEEQLCLDR